MFVDPTGLAAEVMGGGGYSYQDETSFWDKFLYGPITLFHYNYRNSKNKNAPKSIQETEAKGYSLMSDEDSRYHQIGSGNENNKKYVGPEGHFEQVFHEDGSIVTDPINKATYNLFSPEEDPILHGVFDMSPYLLLGNTPDDFWRYDIRLKITIDEGWNRIMKLFNK